LPNIEEGRIFPIGLLGSKPMLQELLSSSGNQPKHRQGLIFNKDKSKDT